MLFKRILTAVVLLPVVVALIVAGPIWSVPALTVLIVGLSVWELCPLTALRPFAAERAAVLILGVLSSVALIVFRELPGAVPAVLTGAVVISFIVNMARPDDIVQAGSRLLSSLAVLLYGVLLPVHLAWLFLAGGGGDAAGVGRRWLLMVLILTWVGDSAAFFVGRAIGRHRLYPAISPKKTWEGAIAGLVGSVLAVWIIRATFIPELALVEVFLLSVPAAILGQLGDFSESLLKRASGIKDSGTLFPGHGGILDRLDALFFAIPFSFYFLTWIHPLFANGGQG